MPTSPVDALALVIFFNFLRFFRHLLCAAYIRKLLFFPQRAHITFCVKRDKVEITFLFFCSVHAVEQMLPNRVVGSCNCFCHTFTTCAIDVPMRFIRQFLSAIAAGLPRSFAKLASCCWQLAYFLSQLPVGVTPATAIPNRLLPRDLFVA